MQLIRYTSDEHRDMALRAAAPDLHHERLLRVIEYMRVGHFDFYAIEKAGETTL